MKPTLALLIAAAIFVSTPAAADDAADIRKADALLAEAKALHRKFRYDEAWPILKEAWELKKSYDIAANLGLAAFNLEMWQAASEYLAFSLRRLPASYKQRQKLLIQRRLDEARSHVVSVALTVSKPGAIVYLDGREIGRAPLEPIIFVNAGPRTISASYPGYHKASVPFDRKHGEMVTLSLTLVKQATEPTPKPSTQPPATPKPPTQPTAAPKPQNHDLSIGDFTPELIIAGVGVAALGIGGGLWAARTAKGDRLYEQSDTFARENGTRSRCREPMPPTACAELGKLGSQAHRLHISSVTMFVVGGSALVGAASVAIIRAVTHEPPPIAIEVTQKSAHVTWTTEF